MLLCGQAGASGLKGGLQFQGGALHPFQVCNKGGLLFGFHVKGAKVLQAGGGILGGRCLPVFAYHDKPGAQIVPFNRKG